MRDRERDRDGDRRGASGACSYPLLNASITDDRPSQIDGTTTGKTTAEIGRRMITEGIDGIMVVMILETGNVIERGTGIAIDERKTVVMNVRGT